MIVILKIDLTGLSKMLSSETAFYLLWLHASEE